MREEHEMKRLLLDFALIDDRIRAVLLQGSRANNNIVADEFQDYDIVYVVRDITPFRIDSDWLGFLGPRLIMQRPDDMQYVGVDEARHSDSFGYLMLFTDGNRVDLTLLSLENFETDFHMDSLTIAWLDKDGLFSKLPPPSDIDYYIRRPSAQEYEEVCNEFWWISTNVCKGLLRNEIPYAKEMTEKHLRPMFMKMIEWKIGAEQNFSVSFGKAGKFMNRYLQAELYDKILQTYSNYEIEANWKSLLLMAELFQQFSNEVAGSLGFESPPCIILPLIQYWHSCM